MLLIILMNYKIGLLYGLDWLYYDNLNFKWIMNWYIKLWDGIILNKEINIFNMSFLGKNR